MADKMAELREERDRLKAENAQLRKLDNHGIEQCPVCFSFELHSAELNGQPAVSCTDCDWIVTYAYLREQSPRLIRALEGEIERLKKLHEDWFNSPCPKCQPCSACIEAHGLIDDTNRGIPSGDIADRVRDLIETLQCVEDAAGEVCKNCGATVDHWMGCSKCGKE